MSESVKCLLIGESNIPRRRKIFFEKKPKTQRKFPELQKYIEAILAGKNKTEASTEDGDRADMKISKSRTSSVCGKSDNKQKLETLRNSISNRGQSKSTEKTLGEGTSKKRGPGSPESDPDVVYSMVGRFLENLYPNPYDVENKNKTKTARSKTKNVDGNLKKVPTMVDLLLVSKGRSEKKATTVKTKKLIIPETENKSKIRGMDSKSQSCFFQEKIEDVRHESQSNSVYSRQTNSRGSLEGVSSTRNNSRGSHNERSSREGESSRVYVKRKTNDRIVIKNSEQTEDSRGDIDFGKLKLLTSKYFSDAIRKNSEMQKGKKIGLEKSKRDTVFVENFSSSKNLKKTRESTNLCVPQELKKGQEKSIKDEYSYEHRSLVQYLNEVNISKTMADREEDERTLEYVLRESENHVVIEEIDRESFRFSRNVKRVSVKEEEEKSEIEIYDEETPDQFWEEFERNSADHQKFYETSKKIDDVLQFMYNCLLKFNNEYSSHKNRKEETQSLPSKSLEENAKPELQAGTSYSSGTYSLQSAKSEENVCHIQSVPLVKDRPGSRELSPEFGESSKQFRQTRKRQSASEHICRSYHSIAKNTYHNPQRGSIWPDPEPPNSLLCESADINPQTGVHTVEIQNELGGYSEEAMPITNDESKISKPILPHSVKFRARKNDACEVIKNALETEEKLLAEGSTSKERIHDEPPENEVQQQEAPISTLTLDKILLRYTPDQVGAYSLFSGVNQQCPYFVIYVNSLPNNLILMFSSPLSISLNEAKTLELKNCEMSKAYSNTLYVNRETFHETSTYGYRFSKDFLTLINKSIVAEIARVVSLIFIAEMTKLEPPEDSNCLVDVLFASKKLMYEEPASCMVFGVSYVLEQKKTNSRFEVLNVTLNSTEKVISEVTRQRSKEESKTEEKCNEKPMQDIENAVEEAEEKVFLLPEPGKMVRKLACLERLVNSNSGSAEKEREKVHDLLLRTYSLQNKLYRYLHKMGCLQPSSSSCPLLRHETFLDFGVLFKQKTSTEVFPLGTVNRQQTDSMVCWPSQTSTTNDTKTETEDKARTSQSEETHHKKETFNDEDDSPEYRSSDCSFKSSSDLSGGNGMTNEDESSRDSKILGKIFNELEISRRSHHGDENSKTELNYENKICELEEKSEPSEQEAKTPTKVLKTLFRGKESLTELSMGLKDFPLIEVSNISVEKKKFSANHTKISIRIGKGKSEELNKDSQMEESGFQINSGVHRNISIYDFDRLRPGLSTCRTEYCRLEGESEDEDEDDFKSVGSSLTESDTGSDEDEKQDKEIELSEGKTFSRTTFTKHKFDYYQSTVEEGASQKKTPEHKALEPLQQALTEMQIRMRTVNRNSFFSNNEYYKRALKLAKMSAGYCQNCGNHTVIPEDTFGFYRNLLPAECSSYARDCIFRRTPSSSFYSFRSHSRELNDRMLDINVDQSSYNLLNGRSVRLGPF